MTQAITREIHQKPKVTGPADWAALMAGGNKPTALKSEFLEKLMVSAVEAAMLEDLGPENKDVTSEAIIDPSARARGTLVLKQPCVVAGLEVFRWILQKFDSSIEVELRAQDNSRLSRIPQVLADFNGPALSILKAERLGLNLLQRMCGIATQTAQFVDLANPARIAVLDTRKTTPTLRAFEKYAVLIAGGTNHRFGLYDSILIKDNHVRTAGGVAPAIERARAAQPKLPIEVETTTFAEVEEAIASGADSILLDNMTPSQVAQAVALIDKRSFIEVSGGVNINNFSDYLIPGVDAISIGALTHSAKNIDISLEIEEII